MCTLRISKYWQGIVEIILRAVCITLMAIGFICSIASVAALSAERTGISFVEDLRFDTRSPTGWLLLVNIIALPLAVVLLLLRFLDVRFIIKNTRVFLMVDIAISAVLAMFYFGGAVPVAVRVGDWKFWRNRASEDEIQRYNFNNIVTSVEATATFSFLITFSLVAIIVWLVLFLVFRWGVTGPQYKVTKEFQPKVHMVTSDSDVSIVKTDNDDSLKTS